MPKNQNIIDTVQLCVRLFVCVVYVFEIRKESEVLATVVGPTKRSYKRATAAGDHPRGGRGRKQKTKKKKEKNEIIIEKNTEDHCCCCCLRVRVYILYCACVREPI